MNHQKDAFITISVIENAIEAQLLESILDERSIPHRIRSHHDTAYDGLFQTQKGWGNIDAPDRYQSEIKQIINQLRSHHFAK